MYLSILLNLLVIVFLALTLVPSVFAGVITVDNRCSYKVSICHVGDTNSSEVILTPDGTVGFQTLSKRDGGGGSIKMGRPDQDKTCMSPHGITQFEYTRNQTQNKIYYNWSNVNCASSDNCPFTNEGISMLPPCEQCPAWGCQAGVNPCRLVYNTPTPPFQPNHGCPGIETDMYLILCRPIQPCPTHLPTPTLTVSGWPWRRRGAMRPECLIPGGGLN